MNKKKQAAAREIVAEIERMRDVLMSLMDQVYALVEPPKRKKGQPLNLDKIDAILKEYYPKEVKCSEKDRAISRDIAERICAGLDMLSNEEKEKP